jgi:hypothetical protein
MQHYSVLTVRCTLQGASWFAAPASAFECLAVHSYSCITLAAAGVLTTDNSAHDPKCPHFRRLMQFVLFSVNCI